MPEESIGDFLQKVSTERKPLTEEEKKEAMVVAREVWKKAMEQAGGRKDTEIGIFRAEDENSRKKWDEAIGSPKTKDAAHRYRYVISIHLILGA